MGEKRIKFTVKKNGGGAFKVETNGGYVGTQCEAEVEAIVGALGATVVNGGEKEHELERDASAIVEHL